MRCYSVKRLILHTLWTTAHKESCASSVAKGTCHKETGAKCALNGVFRPSVVFDYDRHKAVKHMILSNDSGRIIILVVPEGHEVASHSVNADVMVQVLEGEMRFTLEGRVCNARWRCHPNVSRTTPFVVCRYGLQGCGDAAFVPGRSGRLTLGNGVVNRRRGFGRPHFTRRGLR